jgi:thioredoxin reductase (NADPH)
MKNKGGSRMYDLIIIGSGPAGLAAAIYAQRAELNTVILEKSPMSGGQILNTYEVDNYPGLPEINGFDLGMKVREHADKLKANFKEGEVLQLKVEDGKKKVVLENEILEAKAVILATGAQYKKLGVKGEAEFSGMGVSYCATCDGAFFRNKMVVVVGGGDVAVEDAIFLARLCKKVYVVHRRNELRAAKSLQKKLFSMENVEMVWDSEIKEIRGEQTVNSVLIKNKKTETEKVIEVEGVFIAVGMSPNSQIYEEIVTTDKNRYVVADESCETDVPGIFAAGDIRTKQLRQIITAAADGANAITSVERYLNEL